MVDNVYECMFLFDSNSYTRNPNGVTGAIPKMVEDCGGEVLASRLWIEQKLAYPIKGQRKGTYWLTYFRMPSRKVVDFNRACQLNDNILRSLTLKVEPRLADALVAHARGEKIETDEPEVEAETPAEPVAATDEAGTPAEPVAATEEAT